MSEIGEQDTCRICSAPAEPDQPLFHPCKCSGTIRYIHQDCLTTWLSHSKKKTCDVCKHQYSFTKVYAPDMPSTLPPFLMLRQLVKQVIFAILFGFRAFAVATVWLAVVPLITVWSWRMYFALGDNTAWWVSDRPRPPSSPDGYAAGLFSMGPYQYHVIAKAKEEAQRAAQAAATPFSQPQLPTSEEDPPLFSWLFNHPVWLSVSSDIFTGQIIASLVVLTFVATFLLREWIAQNARPGVFDDEVVGNVDDVLQVPPRPPQAARRQLDVNARLVLAQRQIEAMRALDAMLAGRDEELADFNLDRRRDPDDLDRFAALRARRRQRNATNGPGDIGAERDVKQERIRRRNFARRLHAARQSGARRKHELGGLVAAQNPVENQVVDEFALPPDGSPGPASSANSPLSGSSTPASSTPSLKPSSPSSTFFPDVTLERPNGSIPFSFVFPPPGGAAGPSSSSSSNHTDTSNIPPPSYSDNVSSTFASPPTSLPSPIRRPPMPATIFPISGPSTPGTTSARTPLASPSLATYRAPEDLDVEDEYFGRNATAGPSTTAEFEYDANLQFNHFFKDSSTTPDIFGEGTLIDEVDEALQIPSQALQEEESETEDDEEVEEEANHLPLPENIQDEIAFEILQGLDAEEDDEDEDEDEGGEPDHEHWHAVEMNNGAPGDVANVAADVPNGNGFDEMQPILADPLAADVNDELEGGVEDDMDGAMEAIGLRGPFYGVFQNAALMIFLLDTAIGVGICLPFTIGKTTALLSLDPTRLLHLAHLPIRAIRILTDPLVDGIMYLLGHFVLPPYLRLGHFISDLLVTMTFWTIRVVLGQSRAESAKGACVATYGALLDVTNWSIGYISSKTVDPETLATPAPTSSWFDRTLPVVLHVIEPYFAPIGKEVRVGSSEIVDGWKQFATGDGPSERVFSVALGYIVVAVILGLYLNFLTVSNVRTAGRAVRNAIRQQLLVLKVATFIFVELVVFPFCCGIVLAICTIWLFPEASLASRATFFYQAPLTAAFYHWIAGTMFMYSFAVLLSGCRSIIRPGAMWFIKDPQDQNSHPIRDILDRPTLVQLRKIFVSGIMYSFVVVCTVGSVAGLLLIGSRSIMPFRWKNREPLSDVPIDLLFLHFALPYTMVYFRPRKGLKKIAGLIWRYLAARFRLTSYFFGGRHGGEEFTPRGWSFNIFRARTNRDAVLADYDGTFRRVPNTDHLALPRDMRATVAVTPTGEPVDDAARLLMAQQDAETLKSKRVIQDDYTVVYLPPQFRYRVISFIATVWVVGALCIGLVVGIPIQLGRSFFKLFTLKEVHDGYSIIAGFYLLWACYLVGRSIDRLDKRRQRRGHEGPRAALWVLVVKRGLLWMAKSAYMIFFLGIVIPVLIAIVADLYMVMPIRLFLEPNWIPRIRVVDEWALGLVYMRIVLRATRINREHQIARGLQQIKHNGWTHPDPIAATRDVIIPLVSGLLGMILLPGAVFRGMQYLIPSFNVDNRSMFTHVYPGIFIVAAFGRSSLMFNDALGNWSQTVRDKEFLVEMRLKNHEPIHPPSQDTASRLDESGVDLSD
ncbi:hypothetical protein E1B28_007211 [Marasmius oreades]|uniref:RING-type E3 ubiquitin transferase n=1 Tax=Marasmius oreades TaxID=181124 RepID=A0A9P7S1F1_9AGAR|nr:uncharacterized protein E1B28_007211 [Marasmius oreades]KAG7093540.1 hypothetical protein E1B28_007211 [Marasmius oreades]